MVTRLHRTILSIDQLAISCSRSSNGTRTVGDTGTGTTTTSVGNTNFAMIVLLSWVLILTAGAAATSTISSLTYNHVCIYKL